MSESVPPVVVKTGLALLREPFEDRHISPLPKATKAQNECPSDQKIRCRICNGWHHPHVVHLDYVGHAAATHRLLDADPAWSWEPVAWTDEGLPRFDDHGGLWIKLHVCGVTRLGYGNAAKKDGAASSPGDRDKEVIGDAIRNAAMRFGVALDLWHKGDLHGPRDDGQPIEGIEDERQIHPEEPAAAPARQQPARKSAATVPEAGGKPGINAGQLANVNMKIKAAGLKPPAVEQMLKRLGVPAIGLSMTEADWKKVKAEVEKAI